MTTRIAITIFIVFAFFCGTYAQDIAKTISIAKENAPLEWIVENPHKQSMPFTALSAEVFGGDDIPFYYAQSDNGIAFTPLENWTMDEHYESHENIQKKVTNLLILKPSTQYIKLSLQSDAIQFITPNKIILHFFNPRIQGETIGQSSIMQTEEAALEGFCNCPQPNFRTRVQWCTSGTCAPTSAPVATVAGHLVVHHSAGTNVSSNWDAIVTSVWNAHVNTNGWSDIGYNWLIAPTGVLYQGRGDGVLGAHFCGTNAATLGICMLGTYTTQYITSSAQGTLTKMLAFECCKNNIDPLGSGLHSSSGMIIPRICGHQDGCSTECPGTNLYTNLNVLRDSAAVLLNNCSASTGLADAIGITELCTYPNPAQAGEPIYITPPQAIHGAFHCLLHSTTGRLLAQFTLAAGEYSITLPPNISESMLILSLKHETTTYYSKIVVK